MWKLKPTNNTTELVQAWFPGAHSDVGGGSSTKDTDGKLGAYEQLSYIAYVWMLDRVRPYLALDPGELDAQKQDILTIALAEKGTAKPKGWIRWGLDLLKGNMSKMRDRMYGYAGGMITDSHTLLYDLIAFPKPRKPRTITVEEEERGVRTGEVVHPSVWYRQETQRRIGGIKEDNIYQPIAMKGWEREGNNEKGFRWTKKDEQGEVVKSMPEFKIGKMAKDDSLERWLIDRSWCESVHQCVKEDWRSS